MQHADQWTQLSSSLLGWALILLLLGVRSWFQPRVVFQSDRQPQMVPAPDESPEGFYTRLYGTMKYAFETRPMPVSKVGFGHKHLFATRTIFSARPVYFQVKYSHLTYYVYAVRAPDGLFVSSWLYSKYTPLEHIPLKPLQFLLSWRVFQQTMFQADMENLFHSIAAAALGDVVNSYRLEQGLAPLEAHEKRPAQTAFYEPNGERRSAGYLLPIQLPAQANDSAPVALPTPSTSVDPVTFG